MNDSTASGSARRPRLASVFWRALGGWVLVAIGLAGCAVNRDTAATAAEVDLSRLKAVYVVRSADDERGVYIAIVERLRQSGRSPSSGSAAAVPPGTDAVLTYQAQWQWDVTMYLLELRVELRDPRTAALLGMAVSHHTSLTRKTTAEMVDEALGNLFAGGERKPAAPAGALGNADVRLPAYGPAASRRSGPPSVDVALAPVLDERRDGVGALIGERTTIGNISLGMIRLTPPPAQAVAGVLQAEFEAMGWRVAADAPVRVAAKITDFRVVTPATALYWDINGTVELELRATKPGGQDRVAKIRSTCTDRTFVYPGDSLIAGVVQACLKNIGSRLRDDAAWAAFVEGR